MPVRKTKAADLRNRYPIFVQFGLAVSLLLLIVLFTVDFQSEADFEVVHESTEIVKFEEITPTQHFERPPPPPKPPAPIEVPEVDIENEIEFTNEFDPTEAPMDIPPPPSEPPSEPEPEPEIFVIVEDPPELIGGLDGLQQRIQYPELARRAGIEGTVFVQFVVDENGRVQDPVCVRDPGGGTCEEALRAVRASEFKPGRQRGRAVKVRFSLPVRFRLR